MAQATGEPLLNIENLEVVYHNVSTAIQGVTLQVYQNQIVGLLGTNGAGKTTILSAISGFLAVDEAKITEGFIDFQGEKIHNRPPHEITLKGIVLVPEWGKIFEHLTVEENLEVCISSGERRFKRKDLCSRVFGYFPPLHVAKKRLAGYLSGGERQNAFSVDSLIVRTSVIACG